MIGIDNAIKITVEKIVLHIVPLFGCITSINTDNLRWNGIRIALLITPRMIKSIDIPTIFTIICQAILDRDR